MRQQFKQIVLLNLNSFNQIFSLNESQRKSHTMQDLIVVNHDTTMSLLMLLEAV